MAFQPRCSLCYKEIVSSQSIFTSCGHFLCPSCVGSRMNGNSELCPKCGQTCSILYVDENMPDEVQQFICSDPYELLSQAMEILRFQHTHNKAYTAHLESKYQEQKKSFESQITALKAEIERLKGSATPSYYQGGSTLKRPDFLSRFKSTFNASASTPQATPRRENPSPQTRSATPSFSDRSLEKKLVNPFARQGEGRQPIAATPTPSRLRTSLDIPGSITRHPQLTNTPARTSREATPAPPFQLLRPPKSAPVIRSSLP
ncbi:hypothetical protein WA556_003432 [Blastocystis sp. ATCC 50177/Nand II]